ncbi:MAG: penicillin amidase [Cyanobacteria bacterium]|nr:penicillin amidase [Cyanobacteriota bacterium]
MAIHTLASASKPQRPGQCWRKALLIPTLAMGLLDPSQLLGRPALAAAGDTPGGKGAQVYCYMRVAGNNHEVSWIAAYALIKRQSASLFKTSPEHASVMITEAVVQNPTNFPECGKYLGSLYEKQAAAGAAAAAAPTASQPSTSNSGANRSDRPN